MTIASEPRAIAWMVKNPVTANLLMVLLLVGGVIIISTAIKQEIFPDFERERVRISVSYPKASPDEVEKGVLLAVEEAVRGITGIKEITSTASEGIGSVTADLHYDVDKNKVTSEIKNTVDRISSFPLDAERPEVRLMTTRKEVLHLVLYGDLEEKSLRSLIESVREDLLKEKNITQVELEGIRSLEISIEVSKVKLRAFGLTIQAVAQAVEKTAVDMPGGSVKTESGEILIRMSERRDWGEEFKNIDILSTIDGTRVKLGDIAVIKDGFEETDLISSYNGKTAVVAKVYRVGDQRPLDVAESVKNYKKRLDEVLPSGVKSDVRFDTSVLFHQRIDLLKRNAIIGLILVFVLLGLFLETRLAFWVTMGIPISFLGSFLFLPIADVSINMISLFAFIVTLGMVVDDAIVIGENIYYHRRLGEGPIEASIKGCWEVATPVVFSILTTMAAFCPLFFVPGAMGRIFFILPAVILSVLLISLFESIFILPAHLAHLKQVKSYGIRRRLFDFQQKIGSIVEVTAERIYGPIVRLAVKNYWITFALSCALLIICAGIVFGDRVKIDLFPKFESDWVMCRAVLPFGVPLEETKGVKKILEDAARQVASEATGGKPEQLVKGLSTFVFGSHQITIIASLAPIEQRSLNSTEFNQQWRERTQGIIGLESIKFNDVAGGPSGGKAVDVQLSHSDIDILKSAAEELAFTLRSFDGVYDIDDGFSEGKPQLNFSLTEDAKSLGISTIDFSRQVSGAFWGIEALKQQRNRDLVRVMIRYPRGDRRSEYDIDEMLVRTPEGGEVPLHRAARIDRGRSYTVINRTEGKRTVNVTADINAEMASSRKVISSLKKSELPRLLEKYQGLDYSLEGEEKSGNEALDSLFTNFYYVLFVMFALIAIPFRSYIQPIVVLSAIPFGFVGAVLGHMAMGYNISLISLMGILALSGVVVNDSIVLIHTTNRFRQQGMSAKEAVTSAGIRRFRPILLTSLTTFLGLTPMIMETSYQARMLIPMAISLGYGVLFATVIILLIVPCIYIAVEDIQNLVLEIITDIKKGITTGIRTILLLFRR